MPNWAEFFLGLWALMLGILMVKAGLAYWRYRRELDDDDDENEMGV